MENIEKNMLVQSGIKAEFDALCNQYGLPMEDNNYYFLLDLFIRRRQGGAFSNYEIISDYSVLDMASMLWQLSYSSGSFSFKVGRYKKDYTSPLLVEVLKKSLENALQERVKKSLDIKIGGKSYGAGMFIAKGFGTGGYEGWQRIIYYPEGCVPQEVGFSREELELIIKGENAEKEKAKILGGNYGLGLDIVALYNHLPDTWNNATGNAFLAEYLCEAGFLDFKGQAWVDGFKDKTKAEKDREVRNWIDAYQKKQKK